MYSDDTFYGLPLNMSKRHVNVLLKQEKLGKVLYFQINIFTKMAISLLWLKPITISTI